MDAAFAQLSRCGAGPPQRPFRVDQPPLGLIGGGSSQLGQFTGDAHHGGVLGLVAAGRRPQPQFRPDRMRAFTRRTRAVPNLGARRTAGGLDPLAGRADPPHRLGQQTRVCRIGHVGAHHRGIHPDPIGAQQLRLPASANRVSFSPSTATDPHRVVSFINVVGCGTAPSSGIRQNRRQVIESDTSRHSDS